MCSLFLFQSEYIAPCDCRREFICGFNGSAGMFLLCFRQPSIPVCVCVCVFPSITWGQKKCVCVAVFRYGYSDGAACCHVDRRPLLPAGQPADGQQLDPHEDGWADCTLSCSSHARTDLKGTWPWVADVMAYRNIISFFPVGNELQNETLCYAGLKETPSQEDWLISILPENSKVGVDPWIIAAGG